VFLNFTHSSSRAIIKSEPWIPVSPEGMCLACLAQCQFNDLRAKKSPLFGFWDGEKKDPVISKC
ncbi:Hypothetical protein SMAX5B_012016, partial [Scophthalmus maximus]